MRNLRTSLTLFLAAVYLLLGISAAWHAPHFSRGEVAVGVDAHAAGHETPESEDCALCSWKTLSQDSEAAGRFALLERPVETAPRPDPQVSAGGWMRVLRARAPPSLS